MYPPKVQIPLSLVRVIQTSLSTRGSRNKSYKWVLGVWYLCSNKTHFFKGLPFWARSLRILCHSWLVSYLPASSSYRVLVNMLCSKSFLLKIIKVMILHADGEERLLASLFRLVLVVSCSGSPSQPQTSLSNSLLFVKVPKNSVFPRWALPTSHSSPGVLLPLRFIVKGSAAISAFSFVFTSRMTNTWAPFALNDLLQILSFGLQSPFLSVWLSKL